jgi:hypothetical protein
MSSPKRKPETGEEETKKIDVADFSREVGNVNGEGETPAQPRAPAWPLMRQLKGAKGQVNWGAKGQVNCAV